MNTYNGLKYYEYAHKRIESGIYKISINHKRPGYYIGNNEKELTLTI